MASRRVVLVAIKGLGIGGAERLISEGARFWDREAFDYHVAYVLPWKNQLVADLRAIDVPIHLIGGAKGITPETPLRLFKLIRALGASLVHAHLPSMGVMVRLGSPVPVVYTEHNLTSAYRFATRVANRMTYWRNRAVIAVSEAVADSVSRYGGPPRKVILNGVAVPADLESDQVRTELGLNPHQPFIVHVGNIRPGKGHMELVEAASLLQKTDPDAVIVSLGIEKHHGDLERLRRHAIERGLEKSLRFLGQRADALAFTSAADVFVNPSEVEGLPVAVLEAMALGTPVVATAVGGVPSVIRDGESGVLVEPHNPAALAAGIHRLLKNRDEAARLATNARRLIEEEHSLKEMVRSVERVYRQVLLG